MKKVILLAFLFVVLFLGCNSNTDYSKKWNDKYSKQVTVVDGCEYFYSDVRDGWILSHKGTCKNPIHKCDCK